MKWMIAALIVWAAGAAFADDAKPAAEAAVYPLTTCVVSGEPLGEMGEPYVFRFEGREIRFCCKDCRKDFLKDPPKYLKILDEAAARPTVRAADTPAGDKPAGEAHHEHKHQHRE